MQTVSKIYLCLLILFFSCFENQNKSETIRLGVPPRTSFMPIFLASEKGIFKKYDLDVELLVVDKVSELYAERKLDIICTGLTEPITFSSDGHGTQIIYRFSNSLANDIIVGSSKIKKLSELKKKKVSFDRVNSSSHIFVQDLLGKNGISEGEYYAVNLPVNRVLEELEKGNIDAGHTIGVSVVEIEKRGLNILGRSSDNPDLLSDTLSADTEFLKANPEKVKRIIASILEANENYAKNKDEDISILVSKIGKTKEEIEEELKGIRFLSLGENIQSLKTSKVEANNSFSPQGISIDGHSTQIPGFNSIGGMGGLFIAGETIIQFLRERGQLYRMPNMNTILNDTFVRSQEKK